MASTIEIYQHGTKIDTKSFTRDFVIVMDQKGDKLRWEIDGEPASKQGGSILVWVKIAMRPAEIHFIPPGWELIIDGKTIIDKNYQGRDRFDREVNGKIIEIQHNEYKFVCSLDV